jgi:UDP-4-amino-4,6-dideoxy-N-acetyl-beta-L-altrosamine N-acetyltransferase
MMNRKGLAIRLKPAMVTFRRPTPEDAQMVLEWRNSDAVAPYMLRDDPISQVEHQLWFSNILVDTDTAIYRIMEDVGAPRGFISLTRLDHSQKSCEWGGYLAPHVRRGAGVGKAMMYLSAVTAFEQLEMTQMVVEVIIGNGAAIGLYESIGFSQERIIFNRAQRKDGPVDVIQMSLKRTDWDQRKDTIKLSLLESGLFIESEL